MLSPQSTSLSFIMILGTTQQLQDPTFLILLTNLLMVIIQDYSHFQLLLLVAFLPTSQLLTRHQQEWMCSYQPKS